MFMMKRLIPLLLIAVLLLGVTASAETNPNTSCPSCGVSAARDPLFESNHAACTGCGLRNCDPVHARKSHSLCSGCGMRKCDADYDESAHMKCAGCHELLCASADDHTACPGCHRYACRPADHYGDYSHWRNGYGRYTCLDYPEEPETEPEAEPEVEPAPASEPAPATEPAPAFSCPAQLCTAPTTPHSFWLGKCGNHYLCVKLPKYDMDPDYYPAIYENMHSLNECGHYSCFVYADGVNKHYLLGCNLHYSCDPVQAGKTHSAADCA